MDDDKSTVAGQSHVVDTSLSSNMAANPFTQPRGIAPNQPQGVELPPPYSQVPMSRQFPNQTGMPNPVQQQQQMWNPQGYPPYLQPGFPVQTGPEEIRVQQEQVIRHGIATTAMTRRFGRRSCAWRLTRLGISFLLVGIILLIILGVLVIHPTIIDLQLRSTRCKVLSSYYTEGDKSCDCGRYCTSSYPCLQIQVFYLASGKRQTGYLYKDVYDDKNTCSVQPCYSDSSINYYDVRDFDRSHGNVGQSFTCYFNPRNPKEVFLQHADPSSDHLKIMHCVLWPMLVVVSAASMLAILFCRAKGHCCFKKRASSVPYQNLQAAT